MLDFAKLKAPAEDGGVLVEPQPSNLPRAVRDNAAHLNQADACILGRPLSQWRQQSRLALGINSDHPVIVTGHQPASIHPGVWAKNVVASRLATALGATAIHLVVDQDAPLNLVWDVPTSSDGGLQLRQVAFAQGQAGSAYELIPAQGCAEIDGVERRTREALGDRWASSAMPLYFNGFRAAQNPAGWVDQAVAGRRHVDEAFGVQLHDLRVSTAWWSPLVAELLLNAGRFAAIYNSSLADYRRLHKVRGAHRPIPDLLVESDLVELPLWAYQREGGRHRIGVREDGDRIVLIVRGEAVTEFTRDQVQRTHNSCDLAGWLLRPRALTLTLWARLFIADLFIHGIGGAKYDRITDTIIRRYFGIEPPQIACVSATLRTGLPAPSGEAPQRLRHVLRDLYWNPQRHVGNGTLPEILRARRAEAVRQAANLRDRDPVNHRARREAFHAIRELNRQLLDAAPKAAAHLEQAAARSDWAAEQGRIANGREYFVGLYPRAALQRLADTLPAARDFRV